jgi:hypothetical protein
MAAWTPPADIPANKRKTGISYARFDAAKTNYTQLIGHKKTVRARADALKARLKVTPVLSIEKTGGQWHIAFKSSLGSYTVSKGVTTTEKNYPHDSLNENHYFEGVSTKLNGRREADFHMDDDLRIHFSEGGADVPLQASAKGGVMFSHNKALKARKYFYGEAYDELYAKLNGGAVFSNDLQPGSLTTIFSGAYDSGAWFGKAADDVEYWARTEKFYNEEVLPRITDAIKELKAAQKNLEEQYKLQGLDKPFKATKDTGNGTGGKDTKDTKPTKIAKGWDGKLVYNMPGVKDSYFAPTGMDAGILSKGVANGIDQYYDEVLFVTEGDQPAKIDAATDLWNKAAGGNSKGLIQSFVKIGALSSGTKWRNPNQSSNLETNLHTYGFQFLYNPSTVSMNFAGAPAVDTGLELSGADAIPLIGSSATSSTITFQLLLNRMQDMKYVDAIIAGTLDPKVVYPWVPDGKIDPKITALSEVKRIKDFGTMYDIEFLLQTLIGYRMKSVLRGGKTSDIGYLGAYPIELHLGKKLRYLGTIDSFNVSHTIFTKDMIPVFTNLEITFNRLPEYQNYKSGYDSKGGA